MKKITVTLLVLTSINLLACVSHTINEGVEDRGPQIVAAPLPTTQRMTIAISRFTNESVYGSGLFTDQSGDRIGKQASDLLSRHLMATQRFNVMERQDIGKLKEEANLMGETEQQFKQNIKGVDALILLSLIHI